MLALISWAAPIISLLQHHDRLSPEAERSGIGGMPLLRSKPQGFGLRYPL